MGRPSKRGPRAGFTLIELMGVVFVLGLIGTTAYLSWQSILPRTRLNSAVRNLSEHLASARSEAISRSARFEVHYQLDDERYWVETPYFGEGEADRRFVREGPEARRLRIHETNLAASGVEIQSVTIDGETYTDGEVFVRFDPLGASAAHTVVLAQPLFERVYTLEVLPLTGEIRFHDGIHEREQPRPTDFE